jgi:hypothetical protein
MGELVTLGRLCMRDLVEQPRRDRAIKHKIALEQLHLLDRLPALDWGRSRLRGRFVVVIHISMFRGMRVVRIWTKRVCAVNHRPAIIIIILPVVVRLCAICVRRALVVRGGHVGLVIVLVVVRLGVEGVVAVMTPDVGRMV